jgi:hypothetical protein
MLRLGLLVAGLASLLLAAATPGMAAARTVWLCNPTVVAGNPCAGNLDVEAREADGATSVQPGTRARRPKVDCFYVYPTVSNQPGPNADRTIDPELTFVARAQAAQFSKACRVWAPVYRQLTRTAIATGIGPEAITTAYGDVRAAWRDYLAHDNDGRPVVLIGHSQGSFMLRKLIKDDIDANAKVRPQIVSALLLGGNVLVRSGGDVGGDFKHIAACRRAGQTGCVVAWSTFNTMPPPNAMFGRSTAPGLEVLCTDPSRLAGRPGAPLRPTFPSFAGGAPAPYVTYPGLYTAHCASGDGAVWLQVDAAEGDPRPKIAPSALLGAGWGLHTSDISVAEGDLVDIVRRQAAAWKSPRTGAGSRH